MDIAVRGGKKDVTLLTDMNQPLGRMIGNSLEVEECLAILKNEDRAGKYVDTRELSLQLSAAMLELSGKVKDFQSGYLLATEELTSGRAYKKFEDICQAQGGNLDLLPKAKHMQEVLAPVAGTVLSFFNEGLGYAAISLKAGRLASADQLDPSAGIELLKKVGDKVEAGEPFAKMYASDRSLFAEAERRLQKSTQIKIGAATAGPLIAKILKESDL